MRHIPTGFMYFMVAEDGDIGADPLGSLDEQFTLRHLQRNTVDFYIDLFCLHIFRSGHRFASYNLVNFITFTPLECKGWRGIVG
jgi:hypothetical protein